MSVCFRNLIVGGSGGLAASIRPFEDDVFCNCRGKLSLWVRRFGRLDLCRVRVLVDIFHLPFDRAVVFPMRLRFLLAASGVVDVLSGSCTGAIRVLLDWFEALRLGFGISAVFPLRLRFHGAFNAVVYVLSGSCTEGACVLLDCSDAIRTYFDAGAVF